MRPVNKGESPYVSISNYAEALPYLEERIGLYCSYCEFAIDHVPEVEHISAKKQGGDETAWENLLLGCKYCNTRKKIKVTPENKDEHLWPDEDNTALAFSYKGGIPSINEEKLNMVDPSKGMLEKARKLFEVLILDNVPIPGEKDRRFKKRNQAYDIANKSLERWKIMKSKDSEAKEIFLEQTIALAQREGFFSIWMTVFEDEPVVLNALLNAFPGTERTFFNEEGRVILIERRKTEES